MVNALGTLAGRIQALQQEISSHKQNLTAIVTACAPDLLEGPGIGPDTAAALLITAGDNPDRLITEAAFAALWGSTPSKHPPARPPGNGSTAAATAAVGVRVHVQSGIRVNGLCR